MNSRSQRILWLLEELGLDYELVTYPRDPKTNFAPAELKAIHPLGKSPLLGEVTNHLGYISGALGERDYLVGNGFSAADIQMSFVLEVARSTGALESFPNLGAYLERLHSRPAYQRALQRGGPFDMGGQGKR